MRLRPRRDRAFSSPARWAAVAVAAMLVLILVDDSPATFPYRLIRAPHIPPAATLYWPSPTLSNPTTIEVTNDNTRLNLEPGKDYMIQMPPTPVTSEGGVWLVGGRNIVMVGGEIFNDTPIADGAETDLAYGLYLKDQTGTVHLEGLSIHGRGIGQAVVLSEPNGATVQLQHSRLETLHPVGYVHTDGIQSWSGPLRLRLFDVTIVTAGVGLQTQPHQFGPQTIDTWEYRRLNIRQTTAAAYALWKELAAGGWWREIHEDMWVRNRGYLAWPDLAHSNPGGKGEGRGHETRSRVLPGGDFVPREASVRGTPPPALAEASRFPGSGAGDCRPTRSSSGLSSPTRMPG